MPYGMICAVCGRVLDFMEGQGWMHGFADVEGRDHPAVPVDAGEVPVRGRCDFCFADDPRWELPVRDFQANEMSGSDGNWAACEECGRLIETNQWTRLRQRSAQSYLSRHGEAQDFDVEGQIARLHRILRKNIAGALRPI